MSLIEVEVELKKQKSTTARINRKMADTNEKPKRNRTSVVRRSKKNDNRAHREFRHSLHEISSGLNELNIGDDIPIVEKVRLRRSRSFHVTDEHINLHQRTRMEILKQYVANLYQVDVENANTIESKIKHDPFDSSFILHDALENHHIKDIAIHLIKNENINIEQLNNHGQTPLLYAVSLGLVDAVKLLIASGASVNTKDNYGVSALRYAVENGDFEMASLLIASGANAAAVQNGF